jgi:hypothetical protein
VDWMIERFVNEGYARLDEAFPTELARECAAILWRDTGCDPADASTWNRPVVRVGVHAEAPFLKVGHVIRLAQLSAHHQLQA